MTGQGRTAQGDTFVYRVEHPFWEVYHVLNFEHNIDFCAIYGQKWKLLNDLQPYNVVFAKGSRVKVFSAEKL
jgi:hypothetical protein